jgi:DNA-binding winged helix-turn-helix (wHTH) protein/TolB-like protein/Flp pilus assembly protein TadD
MPVMSQQARELFEFGPFRIDRQDRLLLRDARPLHLPPKAVEILILLLENAGHVVDKDRLISTAWPDTFVEEANLAQNISLLRKTLGDEAERPAFIETIPKRGYRFVAPVRLAGGGGETVVVRDTARVAAADRSEEPAAPQRAAGRRRIILLAGAALAAGLAASFWIGRRPAPVPSADVRSIAVLPLVPLGPQKEDYIGLGMADAVITKLANIRQITVRPTSAVRRYASGERDLRAIGRELGVDAVLEGSIQQSGDRFRITVQLLDVRSGATVWTGKFDEALPSLFALQDAISEEVAQALALRLTSEEKRRLAQRYTQNPEAYQLYLKGRFHWNKRSEEGLKRAIDHFNGAIEKDPLYALAYAGLADCYNLFNNYDLYPATESGPRAKAAALKALQLDPDLAEAHTALALAQEVYDYDQEASERSYRRAIELNPNYSTAHHWYGLYLVQMGRTQPALSELQRARELDPLSLPINVGVAWAHYFARDNDKAMDHSLRNLELADTFWPSRLVLGWAYEQKGRHAEAEQEFTRALELSEGSTLPLASLGHLYAVTGKREKAREVLAQLDRRARDRYVSAYFRAAIYTGLGDRERALAWLEKAYEERAYWLISIKVNPWFDPLRSEPRFQRVQERIGFPQS